ncbi:MAG: hypothetical protein IPN71_02740 [Fibrobacteres bacterium]|nr:hypothetical protein [Fibrobacterota bacterium]
MLFGIFNWGVAQGPSWREAQPFPDFVTEDPSELGSKRWKEGRVHGRFRLRDLSSFLGPLANSPPTLRGGIERWLRLRWRTLLVCVAGWILSLCLLGWFNLASLVAIGVVLPLFFLTLPLMFIDLVRRQLVLRARFLGRLGQVVDFFHAIDGDLEPEQVVGVYVNTESPQEMLRLVGPDVRDRKATIWMDDRDAIVLEFRLKQRIHAKIRLVKIAIGKRHKHSRSVTWTRSSRMDLRLSLQGDCREGATAAILESGQGWKLACENGRWSLDVRRHWDCATLETDGPSKQEMINMLASAIQRVQPLIGGVWVAASLHHDISPTLAGNGAGALAFAPIATGTIASSGADADPSFDEDFDSVSLTDLVAGGEYLLDQFDSTSPDVPNDAGSDMAYDASPTSSDEQVCYESDGGSSGSSDDYGGTCSDNETRSSD